LGYLCFLWLGIYGICPKLCGQEEVFLGCQGMPEVTVETVTEREAARQMSLVGGQGVNVSCNCKEKCDNKCCKCKSNDVFCNSKCHLGNIWYMNHEAWKVLWFVKYKIINEIDDKYVSMKIVHVTMKHY